MGNSVQHDLWLAEQNFVPKSSVLCCSHCLIRFNFLVHKHHCHVCGDIFCSTCTDKLFSRSVCFPCYTQNIFVWDEKKFGLSSNSLHRNHLPNCENKSRQVMTPHLQFLAPSLIEHIFSYLRDPRDAILFMGICSSTRKIIWNFHQTEIKDFVAQKLEEPSLAHLRSSYSDNETKLHFNYTKLSIRQYRQLFSTGRLLLHFYGIPVFKVDKIETILVEIGNRLIRLCFPWSLVPSYCWTFVNWQGIVVKLMVSRSGLRSLFTLEFSPTFELLNFSGEITAPAKNFSVANSNNPTLREL